LGIGLHCVRFDRIVEDIQPPTGSSGEAWLAEHRHRHLADVAREFSRDALILTGHQADDHAESLLLGLMRGNDWAGLTFPVFQCWYGMPVAAPLALSRRTDLRQWLAGRGLDWLDDPMNSEPHSMRSVIRGLLDRLQCETARDWVLPLTRSAESLRLAGDCLQGQCERVLEECLDDGERLSIRAWRRQHGALRPGILRSYGNRTHCALSGRQVHQLAHWMETCPLREGRLVLGSDQNMVAVVHSGMLLLTRVPGSDAPPPAP
jgi:tRNA(Ile)-lysidine synthase